MKLIKTLVLVVIAGFVMVSCGSTVEEKADNHGEHEHATKDEEHKEAVKESTEEGYVLYKKHCVVCHGGGESHDAIIAPPMMAVKRHYFDESIPKAKFAENIVNWVKNPSEDKAQMFGAINKFKIMPKMGFPEDDVIKIAFWLYDNDPPEPKWFDKHLEEEGETRESMGNAWKSEISLNDGKKWEANKETTEGMNTLLAMSNKFLGMDNLPDSKLIHKMMKKEIESIINDCSMEGVSHDNLHIYLLPLINKIDKLEEVESPELAKRLVGKVKEHLEEYSKYFE